MTGCRIGRVKMKGGADVRVLDRPEVSASGAELMRHARALALSQFPGQSFSFVTVAWSDAGAYSMGYQLRDASVVTLTMLPTWIAEAVRRDAVMTAQVRQVIDREYVTPRGPAA